MSGGLIQLVATGTQDIFLTGNSQITFWSMVYRRHTNFAVESFEVQFSGTVDFGRKATCLIPRNGDLIHKMYLEIGLPALTNTPGKSVCWAREIGHVLISEAYIDIGGTTIDKHYGIWLSIWNELTQTAEKEDTYRVTIGDTTALTDYTDTTKVSTSATTIQVPLQFWFNQNPGLALPLVSLMYHEVKLGIQLRPASECYVTSDGLAPSSGTPVLTSCSLFIDYVFLDSEERKMFSQNSHEYLITQLQYNGGESVTTSTARLKLNFSHPTKELIWTAQPADNLSGGKNRWIDWTDNGTGTKPFAGADTVAQAKIQVNNNDRISLRSSAYYSRIVPLYCHTRGPSTGIYVYSFALKPEEHQPSGSINLSRIESTTLFLNLTTGTRPVTVHVFAVSYNVLRIVSGLGGLAFAS
ncbi:hypothetical protein M427DRAFT_50137 [Gonapodya prolifera JEL478]|uniref:Uncharacterized protein n=1 Tax=Gonapodya prolifera (strain JEL478) TaxID=1344416 RepID=A0A138ZWU4_GONPJ|nr:hypothetical protein M427DRAFT_50137 [Gonapodya prolifera JEL478]|eukprot:KXS08972.1 hypothetical protein M427DRAFT_50137 [Gonapodya prolifera JEL478]